MIDVATGTIILVGIISVSLVTIGFLIPKIYFTLNPQTVFGEGKQV